MRKPFRPGQRRELSIGIEPARAMGRSARSAREQSKDRTMTLRLTLFVLIGAVCGFGYHRIVGCHTGTCPITANPYISTAAYGALLGYLVSGGLR